MNNKHIGMMMMMMTWLIYISILNYFDSVWKWSQLVYLFFLYMLFMSSNVSIKLIYHNLLETLHDLQERNCEAKFHAKTYFFDSIFRPLVLSGWKKKLRKKCGLPYLPSPPLLSGHCLYDSQTDSREGSGFICVILWPLLCIDTSVCFSITDHSIRSRISESYNNSPESGKLTCCLF